MDDSKLNIMKKCMHLIYKAKLEAEAFNNKKPGIRNINKAIRNNPNILLKIVL